MIALNAAKPPSFRLDAFTPDLPRAASAEDAVIAARAESCIGGLPVKAPVPLTNRDVRATASRRASLIAATAAEYSTFSADSATTSAP